MSTDKNLHFQQSMWKQTYSQTSFRNWSSKKKNSFPTGGGFLWFDKVEGKVKVFELDTIIMIIN